MWDSVPVCLFQPQLTLPSVPHWGGTGSKVATGDVNRGCVWKKGGWER